MSVAASRVIAEPAAVWQVAMSHPAEPCEAQADRAAEAVSAGQAARLAAGPGTPDSGGALRRATGLTGAGQPLDERARQSLEPRFTVARPGTPVTPRNPGWTISAPLAGGVAP